MPNLPMHLGLTCPFCLGHVDVANLEEGDREGEEGYECASCGAHFATVAMVSPELFEFWEKASENRDYESERVEKEVAEKLAVMVMTTTTPTYGSGEMWAVFNEWKRRLED